MDYAARSVFKADSEITERTVKAHLTGVYRKLGVVDRLRLALVLTGDERHDRRSSTKLAVNSFG